jgi:hypothetical protein
MKKLKERDYTVFFKQNKPLNIEESALKYLHLYIYNVYIYNIYCCMIVF